MWDSAKKPIKVRTIIQPNGMRHFIVHEESNVHSKPRKPIRPKNDQSLPSQPKLTCPLLVRSNTFDEGHPKWPLSYENPNFFGVEGSKINNSKYKTSRYFQTFQKSQNTPVMRSYSHTEALDFLPVKSPVIKQLINGTRAPAEPTPPSAPSRSQTTTLCSRIMTWIDLEVKRNATTTRGNASGLSFNEPSLLNDLPDYSPTSGSSSDAGSSTTSSSDSSGVSLPKLIPCWKKGGVDQGKKSVRICEDLPRWGKMKRRMKRRTASLSELHDVIDNQVEHTDVQETEEMESGDKLGNNEDGLVVDENATGSGRLQVHIFLPQTE